MAQNYNVKYYICLTNKKLTWTQILTTSACTHKTVFQVLQGKLHVNITQYYTFVVVNI